MFGLDVTVVNWKRDSKLIMIIFYERHCRSHNIIDIILISENAWSVFMFYVSFSSISRLVIIRRNEENLPRIEIVLFFTITKL